MCPLFNLLIKGVSDSFGDRFCRRVLGVCLDFVSYIFFSPLAAKLVGPRTVCQFFKQCQFF